MELSEIDFSEYLSSLKSKKFKELWPAQGFVLEEFRKKYLSKHDVAIELPTGAGKTLISLLISGVYLKQNKKVAILSANKTLARQMKMEAEELGLKIAYMEGEGKRIPARLKRSYQRKKAVGIMNYWVYFNQNPAIDPADVVIMDDAHLAEHCLDSLYSVSILKKDHTTLFNNLIRELYNNFPDYQVLHDALIEERPPGTGITELLSFIDKIKIENRYKEIIDSSQYLEKDIDLKFRWGRLREKFREANLYVSQDEIWLRPYIYPLINHEYYKDTKQVLYMSATIGNPGDLACRLGVNQITKINVPDKFSKVTAGRRLILMNKVSDEADIPQKMEYTLFHAIKSHKKSLWLCTSKRESEHVKEVVEELLANHGMEKHPTWLLTSTGDEIEQFRDSQTGHLFVAGRFDGMDFDNEECRIVVLCTMPRATNIQEEFIVKYLRDNSFMDRRLNQRIIQALGRCNRAEDDYGIYFLADRRFSTYFSRDSKRVGLSPSLYAEIDLAQDLAEMTKEEQKEYVSKFLQGDFSEYDEDVEELKELLPEEDSSQKIVDTTKDEIIGWAALFESQNYEVAEEKFGKCWQKAKEENLLEAAALHGWHRAKALYLQSLREDEAAREKSLKVLEKAIKRGGQSSWFNRMGASLNRARKKEVYDMCSSEEKEYAEEVIDSLNRYVERWGNIGNTFQREINKNRRRLESNNHDEYCLGLEKFGDLLGFIPKRPKGQAVTDCTWRGTFGSNLEFYTFEAKIEHQESNSITASDLGQAHNQEASAKKEFGCKGYTVCSSIVTHLAQAEEEVTRLKGQIKIIKQNALLGLWDHFVSLFTKYRSNWSPQSIEGRREAAQSVRLYFPKTGWLQRAHSSAELWITADLLLTEWKQD